MIKKNYEIDMCSGTLFYKIILFSVPLILSGVLQLLFHAADVVVVGRYVGKEALAAVGSNTVLLNMLVNMFTGVSVGSNVLVAKSLGAKQTKVIPAIVHTTIALAALSGVLLAVTGTLLAKQLLIWMSSPHNVIEQAASYLRIYFIGIPGTMVYNFSSALLRAKGDTQRPLLYLIAAGISNVLMNLFFVIVLHLGVVGVGLATAISQYLAAFLILCCLHREKGILQFHFSRIMLERKIALQILRVGIPVGLQSTIFGLSNVVIQSAINTFGDIVMAGSAAAGSIEGFIYTSMNAVSQGALTFTSQNMGAKQYKRVDRIMINCLILATAIGVVLGNLAYRFGNQLIALYAPGQPEVIEQGLLRLQYYGRNHVYSGIMEVTAAVVRGLGYPIAPTVVSLLGSCGIRLLWVYIVFPINPVPEMLYIAYPICWSMTALMQMMLYFFGRKKKYQ